jgi:class 3 adenylate cyclase/ribosomal protein L40E
VGCAKCKYENPTDALFCMKCGTKVENHCPSCNTSNPADANFCRKCGTAVGAAVLGQPPGASAKKSNDSPIRVVEAPAPENLEGERKTVTALFADIKGSTELEQDLDPEEARAIIDPALTLMIDAVRRYDGYIVQSTGDGIFALFGAPVAHEDHPQRSLHAARRMQEEIRRYADRQRSEGRAPIQIRVGVNTGEVVVRSITTGAGQVEYMPIGHTTNLASRMQTLANPGSTVIAESTRKLVEGYFALKALGATKVKGVSEPVLVYEVTGLGPLRTRLQRSAGRGLTKFVGRQREMDAMKHAAEQAKAGRGQIVAAMAEAGVGKSRLFFEFKAKNQSGWNVLETFSVSHGKASAYFPVIDLLHGYFKISGEDDQRERRVKVNGNVLTLDRKLEDTLPYLFGLLGIVEGDDPLAQMDANVRKRRTLDAIKRILLRESLNQPLIVMFEDLHWIDEQTQEFLNLLADSIANAKILLLVNYRPEYSHQWGFQRQFRDLHTRMQHAYISAGGCESGCQYFLGVPIESAF